MLPACRVTRAFAQLMAATPNAPVTNAVGARMAHSTCYRAIVTLVYSPRQQQRSLNAPVTTGLIARQAPRERRALVTGSAGNSSISPVASRHVNCAGNKQTRWLYQARLLLPSRHEARAYVQLARAISSRPVTRAIGPRVLLPACSFHQTLPGKTVRSQAEPVTMPVP